MFVTMMSGMRGDISLVADFSLDGRTEGWEPIVKRQAVDWGSPVNLLFQFIHHCFYLWFGWTWFMSLLTPLVTQLELATSSLREAIQVFKSCTCACRVRNHRKSRMWVHYQKKTTNQHTLACFSSNSTNSTKFFLKATTRRPLKSVRSGGKKTKQKLDKQEAI
jgi:hypothetical protein